jgi:hypothetical protein
VGRVIPRTRPVDLLGVDGSHDSEPTLFVNRGGGGRMYGNTRPEKEAGVGIALFTPGGACPG